MAANNESETLPFSFECVYVCGVCIGVVCVCCVKEWCLCEFILCVGECVCVVYRGVVCACGVYVSAVYVCGMMDGCGVVSR